jgi:hypothetical protein
MHGPLKPSRRMYRTLTSSQAGIRLVRGVEQAVVVVEVVAMDGWRTTIRLDVLSPDLTGLAMLGCALNLRLWKEKPRPNKRRSRVLCSVLSGERHQLPIFACNPRRRSPRLKSAPLPLPPPPPPAPAPPEDAWRDIQSIHPPAVHDIAKRRGMGQTASGDP